VTAKQYKNNNEEAVMHTKAAVTLCLTVFMVLSLSFSFNVQPAAGAGEKFVEEFKAVLSSSTIKVGQSAVVTFTGAHLDVAGGNSFGDIGDSFASIVEVTPAGKAKFTVKGLAPGNAVLKFSNGDKEATVRVRVVTK
jgi:hypothetical protein